MPNGQLALGKEPHQLADQLLTLVGLGLTRPSTRFGPLVPFARRSTEGPKGSKGAPRVTLATCGTLLTFLELDWTLFGFVF